MKTKKQADKEFKCDQPGCEESYAYAKGLGSHKLRAHGIPGSSPSVLRARARATAKRAKTGAPEPAGEHWRNGNEIVSIACKHCPFVAKWKGGMTYHMKKAHPEVTSPARKTKKETALVKRTTKTITLNGQAHENGQGHSDAQTIPDALVALTTGRFQELCRSIAFEHDLPPRMFTAKVAALVYATAVR